MKVAGGLERNGIFVGLLLLLAQRSVAFTSCSIATTSSYCRNGPASVVLLAEKDDRKASETTTSLDGNGSDNKAMAFLRRIGKVGGTAQQDFTNAVGVDEGPAGKNGQAKKLRKCTEAYTSCVVSGIIDDLSELFPATSSGTQWVGVTDKIRGGVSSGSLTREAFEGRPANVLRATVRQQEEGGFVQMTADLSLDPSVNNGAVDASTFDGLEVNLMYGEGVDDMGSFHVHLKNAACNRQFWSYRSAFELPKGSWTTVRLPFSGFYGHGDGIVGTKFDTSTLRRLGIVASGTKLDVTLALSSVGFYKNA